MKLDRNQTIHQQTKKVLKNYEIIHIFFNVKIAIEKNQMSNNYNWKTNIKVQKNMMIYFNWLCLYYVLYIYKFVGGITNNLNLG